MVGPKRYSFYKIQPGGFYDNKGDRSQRDGDGFLKEKYIGPECSTTGMGQFTICKLKWDLLRTSITACTIDKNTFSAPFGIFLVQTEI